jgi:hypothetical protein
VYRTERRAFLHNSRMVGGPSLATPSCDCAQRACMYVVAGLSFLVVPLAPAPPSG